jgi:autotransporter-associated beta strand protein
MNFVAALGNLNHWTEFVTGKCRELAWMLVFFCLWMPGQTEAAGTWTAVAHAAPSTVQLMLLLSDGTVMCSDGGSNTWHRLTPDIHGSYINGTWTALASMHDTRLYYSSDVLPDGRVFVAGGEYGTGDSSAEVYDSLSNTWTRTPSSGQTFSDSISKVIPNGSVLVAPVDPSQSGYTAIYNDVTNVWSLGPKLYRGSYQDEASWVRLPDDSILTIDPFGTNSERYIPSINAWINDANVPVQVYDPYGSEEGAGFLLPNGKAIFLGSTGHNALYTPSGSQTPGTWVAAPDFPNTQGTPDAPAAMMANGNILCAVSPTPTSANHFPSPTSFYEYNYVSNVFTQVSAPGGGTTRNISTYVTTMLDLPDGTVLYSEFGTRLYVYQPSGAQLTAGMPAVLNITPNLDGSYHLTGTLLNGISEGAAYGDDNQMNSNYPLIRLVDGAGHVYYCRTYNWSSTSVMNAAPSTTEFRLPAGLPAGIYSLIVSANGISSNPTNVALLTWNGAISGNWDTNTANWTITGGTTNFNPGSWVTFDDTLTGATNVVLTTTLTPGGMTFNNSISNYVVSGTGNLSGSTAIIKSGSGTVTLTETGGDNFSGGIAVNSGTLILDNTSPTLTGATVIGGSGILQVGNVDANGGLPSGVVTNNGLLVFNQTADLTAGNLFTGAGIFAQNGTNTLTLTAVNPFKGKTLVNAGTLALSGNGSLAAATNINLAAGATFNVTNRFDGMLTLTNDQLLQGNGTVIGFLTSLPGATIMPGTNASSVGSLAVSTNVTLLGTTQLKVDAGNSTNDTFSAAAFTYGGTLFVTNLSATPLSLGASYPIFTATNYTGAFSSVFPVAAGPRLVWNTNQLTVNGALVVGYTPGDTWDGTNNGNWDTTTTNWWNAGNEISFTPGDPVTFDDTLTGTTSVTLTAAMTPASVLFNNSQSNYLFGGTGSLSGGTGINKFGSGSVTFAETGGDNFSGGLRVNSGAIILDWANAACSGGTFIASGASVRAGLNDANGNLPSGLVTNNGTLTFSRSANFSVVNNIFGSGTLIQNDTNTTTVLGNNFNWTGTAIAAQGTLRLGASNCLGGGTNSQIIVSNTATLDANGITGTNAVIASGTGVGGLGAVVNNSPTAQAFPALAFLTLAGNTTIGGTSRWDLRPASASPDSLSPNSAGLNTGGHAYSLTKVGTNFIGIVSATVDPALAAVNVQAGTLDIEGSTTGLGTNGSITVFTNATLEFWSLSSQLTKPIYLTDGATIFNGNAANTLNCPLILASNTPAGRANCTFNIAGSYLWTLLPISGPGNLIKTGSSILYVNVTNTYTGNTVIKAGVLELWSTGAILTSSNVNVWAGATFSAAGRSDNTVQLNSGQFLQGNGTVSAIVNASAGSTIMPGTNSTLIASLTISSNVTFHGTCRMKLNPANVTSDAIHATGVTYGGTLSLTNISATPLSAGNSFHLFFANSYTGAFTTITPAIPGIGLAWNTNTLNTGILNVVALTKPILNGVSVSGNNLVFNGTNAVAGRTYVILTATDLTQPLNQWLPVTTNVPAASGNFVFTAANAFNASGAPQFYLLQAQ